MASSRQGLALRVRGSDGDSDFDCGDGCTPSIGVLVMGVFSFERCPVWPT